MDAKDGMDALLAHAKQLDASDVHFTAGLPVQIRVRGAWQNLGDVRLAAADCEVVGQALCRSQEAWERFRKEQEYDTAYSIAGVGRFRVNLFFQRGSVGAACRSLPIDIPYFEDLGLPEERMEELSSLPHGLVLVCGATGSGKSTTLAAMVGYINRTRRAHIVTIEDPIEFLHRHGQSIVDQREVGLDTHSFTAAMRHALRQSPDVVLIGEIRDAETVRTAVMLAETGHLVLSSLHSAEASQALSRLTDIFPTDQQEEIRVTLAAVLRAILVQQLLPGRAADHGLVLAYELLLGNGAVQATIRQGRFEQLYSQMQTMQQEGMSTMNQSLLALLRQEEITPETALARSPRLKEMQQLLKTL
jgi:twitching motility protein PilT